MSGLGEGSVETEDTILIKFFPFFQWHSSKWYLGLENLGFYVCYVPGVTRRIENQKPATSPLNLTKFINRKKH